MLLGSAAVYAMLFATGLALYGRHGAGALLALVSLAAGIATFRAMR